MQVKKQKKKAGHLEPPLAQTSRCSYGTRRGRETQELAVPLRKTFFSGHIKDKLPCHDSEAGIGDSEPPLSPPSPSSRPPVPFPDTLIPQGIARSLPVLRLFSTPCCSRFLSVPCPPPSLLVQNNSKAPVSAASRGKPRSHIFREKEIDMIIFLLLFRTRNEVLPL